MGKDATLIGTRLGSILLLLLGIPHGEEVKLNRTGSRLLLRLLFGSLGLCLLYLIYILII